MTKYSNKIREIIIDELIYLGYDLSLMGTSYLLESIYIIINKRIIDNINLKNEIYPIIARKYNTNVNNIKCSINYASTIMYFNCPKDKIENYFKIYNNTKPSSKKIINSISNVVERKKA